MRAKGQRLRSQLGRPSIAFRVTSGSGIPPRFQLRTRPQASFEWALTIATEMTAADGNQLRTIALAGGVGDSSVKLSPPKQDNRSIAFFFAACSVNRPVGIK